MSTYASILATSLRISDLEDRILEMPQVGEREVITFLKNERTPQFVSVRKSNIRIGIPEGKGNREPTQTNNQ